MATTPRTYEPPGLVLLNTEMLRAATDAASYVCALPGLVTGPPGDGHHVLVLPGLLAGDISTLALRQVLRARGFRPHTWSQGINVGPTRTAMEGVLARLESLYERDAQPVSIIGWSLGGVLGRELARQRPDLVRCVITLGSPFRLTANHSANATHAGWVYEALRPWHTGLFDHGLPEEDLPPLAMPSTSIYSRSDGIVPWEACQELPGALRENIEVCASHLGMGCHPEVLRIVLDRLAQPAGVWQPYAAA